MQPIKASDNLQRAQALRRRMTPTEARLWGALKRLRSRGFHFRRQAPFRGYVLDFVCYSRRVVVEVDGPSHAEPRRARRDFIRDAVLAREGFRTLRFANSDVYDLDAVVTRIVDVLEERPHPGRFAAVPPHKGEGEG